MELIWGIFLFTITFLHTTPSEAGRVLPVNSKSFMKRVGPFFNERRVYNHPYIEDHHVRVRSYFALLIEHNYVYGIRLNSLANYVI